MGFAILHCQPSIPQTAGEATANRDKSHQSLRRRGPKSLPCVMVVRLAVSGLFPAFIGAERQERCCSPIVSMTQVYLPRLRY